MRCKNHSKSQCPICFPHFAQILAAAQIPVIDNSPKQNLHNEFSESYSAHDGCGYDSSNIISSDFNSGCDPL